MAVRSIVTNPAPAVSQYGVLLAAGILTSASAGIGVSGIPQTYRNLKVIIRNAKSGTATTSYLQGYFNASYSNFLVQSLTLDTNSYYPNYSTNFYMGGGIQALKNNTWITEAHFELTILNYSSTTQTKNGHWVGGGQSATDRIQWSSGAVHWNSTAAITSLGFAAVFSTGTFAAGSTIEIYGEGPLS